MAETNQKQLVRIFVDWWISRIIHYSDKKKGGIGLSELQEYADFQKDFSVPTLPPEECLSHIGHCRLVSGKNGFETFPPFKDVEYIIENARRITIPASAVSIDKNGKFIVRKSNGVEAAISLAGKMLTGTAMVEIQSGLTAGDKILVQEPHPQAGQLMIVSIPMETSALWDKFAYLSRLLRQAGYGIWSGAKEVNEKARSEQLERLKEKMIEVASRCLTIKKAPPLVAIVE